ncbi:phospholipid/cholesterol/gamma-HCH transport system substrate-binding protein [Marmoricola sp. OAE513]|uniref:MCE family protein n=1 Tax=Marmoricola sp. OAE513 TaxID=2817894 RepID=UPI001AE585FB
MARHTDQSIRRLGIISLTCLLVVMAAAFNLQRFPGFRGTGYSADFADASGLAPGDMVQMAGVKIGKVTGIEVHSQKVRVRFELHGQTMGEKARASVEVLNLLGSKYLRIESEGAGDLPEGSTIPLSRTRSGYDIVSTLSHLATTTEDIDTGALAKAFTTLSGTLDAASPDVRASFTGISRVSRAIAERDQALEGLLHHADSVTALLAARKGDLVALMEQGDLVFAELQSRSEAIHALLVNARRLAQSLRGVVKDNEAQIGPALADLQTVVTLLQKRESAIRATIHNLAPYARILVNVIGTGPWFDAYVPNLVGLASGEFAPGER